jgi:hypothetical protein
LDGVFMALELLISLGVAKIVTAVTLAKIARRKKQAQEPKGTPDAENNKVAAKGRG